MAGPDMAGNTPSLLNAVLAKFSGNQLLSLPMFFSVVGKGGFWGQFGN